MAEDVCIFCAIAAKGKPADIVWESDSLIVIKDIKPSAPVHLLIVSKKHVSSIKDLSSDDKPLVADMIFAAKDIARREGLPGYRLCFNVGRAGGQIVDHIHLHLIGGWS